MDGQLNETEVKQLREVLHHFADYRALFETTVDDLKERDTALSQRLQESEIHLSKQLGSIKDTLGEFQQIMTETGAARWRVAAEQALKEGKKHLKLIQDTTDAFVAHTQNTCERLDRTTGTTVKSISRAVHTFNIDEFRNVTADSCHTIQQSCSTAMTKIGNIMSWFHWRNFALVSVIALMITFVTGLYINDQWPWESHETIVKERNLAEAVVSSWSNLSPSDQQKILQNTQTDIG